LLGIRISLFCYDSLGNQVFQVEDLDCMARSTLMTFDGKYYLITSGGIIGEGFERTQSPRLEIYDVYAHKKVFTQEVLEIDNDFGELFQFHEFPNWILAGHGVRYKTDSIYVHRQFINLSSNKICFKYLSKSEFDYGLKEKIVLPEEYFELFNFTCNSIW